MMGAPGNKMPAWHRRARAILTVVRFAAGRSYGPQASALCGVLVTLAAGCGAPSSTPPVVAPVPDPGAPPCGDGLAAVDLAGQCREKPRATMGAIEAVTP